MKFPDPVICATIAPKSKADEERLARALSRIAQDDGTFHVKTDVETGLTYIFGMGELHLEIVVDRLKREFNVALDVGTPRVAYKETICKTVVEEGKFIRQTGGRKQYGHVVLKIEPQPRGAGFSFVREFKIGILPPGIVPAIERGVREALEGGALAGHPLVDLKVSLLDGSFDEAASDEMSFKIAGAMALRSGCKKADPVLLEPIMKLDVEVSESSMGDVIGDLNARRAQILDMGDRKDLKFVRCDVPLSELFGYATVVRSITMGRASFTLEPSHYAEVPWEKYRASIDPHNPDEPPAASAGRPVKPIRPKPGLSGGEKKRPPRSGA